MEAASRPLSRAVPHLPDGRREPAGVSTLLRLLERAHRNARAHGHAVSSLSVRIGRHLGLGLETLGDLRLAGRLHDVGKLSVPARIVEKPGPLSEAEWTVVRAHPVEGERLLRPFVDRTEVLAAVRWHHERWDGGGYPDRLRRSATPVTARIVAVADAFSAMVEPRPYREMLSRGAAVEELERYAGSQFDPECVSALARVLSGREGGR